MKIETIDSLNYETAADCLSDVFYHHEPVTSLLGLDYSRYRQMMRRFCRVIGKNGLCFTSLDTEKGITAGTITNIDQMTDFGEEFADEPEDFGDVLEKLSPDIAMTGALVEPFLKEMNFKRGECIHFFQCAVLPEYSGKGVASALVDYSIAKGIEHGYQWASVTCTSERSMSIFVRRGFEIINRIVYSNFIYKGTQPFKNLSGNYVLLAKKIN